MLELELELALQTDSALSPSQFGSMSGGAGTQQLTLDDESGDEGLAALLVDERYSDIFATVLQALPDRYGTKNFKWCVSLVTTCF